MAEKIGIALIGYGYWGANVAQKIAQNEFLSFLYICDKRRERIEKAKALYREKLSYIQDYKEMLQDQSVKAVAITVETEAHYEVAKEALLAGKHVYIEKPFTSTSDQGEELQRLAHERQLTIHVDHIMIYHPVIKDVKRRLDSGELGEILYFDCSRINLGKIRADVNSMWDLTVHDLSVIDYLSEGKLPREIKCVGQRLYSAKESVTSLLVKYDGFFATMTSSWLSPIKERRIIMGATKKMVLFNDLDLMNKYVVYDKGYDVNAELESMEYDKFSLRTRNGGAVIPELPQEDALYNSIEHFRTCICEKKESLSGPAAAVRLLKILEKADRQLEEEKGA